MSWLNIEFGKREYLRRLVEAESYELLRLAQKFGQEAAVLTSIDDAVMQLARLMHQAQDLSPYWRVDFATAPDKFTAVCRERYPGAAALDPVHLRAAFNFPDGDAAAADVQQRLAAVLDYGGDIEIDGRYLADLQALASPASRALFDVSGPTKRLRITSVPLQTADLLDYQLVVVGPFGVVKTRLALVMQPPTVGQRGSRVTGREGSGTFDVVMTRDRPEFGGAVKTHLTVRGIAGRYPYQVRPRLECDRAHVSWV